MAKEGTVPATEEQEVEYFDFSPTEVGDPVDETPEEKEPVKVALIPKEESEPKDDPLRMEYWQSVADKRQKRLMELEPLAPIQKLFQEDPDLITELEKVIAKKRQPVGPQRPAPPERPVVFNEVESVTDPSSDSWKFRQQKEEYHAQLLDFYDQREATRQAQLEEEGRQRKAEEGMRQEHAKLRLELTAKGVPEADHEKFIQMFSKPGTVNLDHLVVLYNTVHSQGKAVDKKAADLQRRNARQGEPTPVGIEGGESDLPEEDDPQANFNRSLLAYRRK